MRRSKTVVGCWKTAERWSLTVACLRTAESLRTVACWMTAGNWKSLTVACLKLAGSLQLIVGKMPADWWTWMSLIVEMIVGRIVAVGQIFALIVVVRLVVVAQPSAIAVAVVAVATSFADHDQTCSCATYGPTCFSSPETMIITSKCNNVKLKK